jgi:hypothetical protein
VRVDPELRQRRDVQQRHRRRHGVKPMQSCRESE